MTDFHLMYAHTVGIQEQYAFLQYWAIIEYKVIKYQANWSQLYIYQLRSGLTVRRTPESVWLSAAEVEEPYRLDNLARIQCMLMVSL